MQVKEGVGVSAPVIADLHNGPRLEQLAEPAVVESLLAHCVDIDYPNVFLRGQLRDTKLTVSAKVHTFEINNDVFAAQEQCAADLCELAGVVDKDGFRFRLHAE